MNKIINKLIKLPDKIENTQILKNSINNKIAIKSNKKPIIEPNKELIIDLFNKNIKGKKFISSNMNKKHCGEEGHWLEKLMGIKPNSKSEADIKGYEMKKSAKKISFGDWSASEYLFSENHLSLDEINNKKISISREQFIKYFGHKNLIKNDRYSWSGSCVPKYGLWNNFGQTFEIDKDNNILAIYDYSKDNRRDTFIINKDDYSELKNNKICIAIWKCEKMEKHVNDKFNQNGFFICKKSKDGIYDKICFGPKIDYKLFLTKFRENIIYFDSGMYHDTNKKNTRLYSQFRANLNFWEEIITQEF